MFKSLMCRIRKVFNRIVMVVICVPLTTLVHSQDKNCALVLMHGKWGSPKNLISFANRLDSVCEVKSLEMPWSGRRSYDQPYPIALAEIDVEVKAFRAKEYKHVLVGGQSFGANAALAYMASVGDADGLIVLAPGHSPKAMYDKNIGKTEVDQARELITAGQGEMRLTIEDVNQGQRRQVSMSANTLFSYFDPDGLGHIPGTTKKLKTAVPVLWVIATADPLFQYGEGYAYANLPAHPKNKYLVVEAGHGNTPDVAANNTLEWLKSLN